jgi:hypothetical protein
MEYPRIKALHYRLRTTRSGFTFINPSPQEASTEAFDVRLADGVVTFTLRGHHSSLESALALVEPYLRSWMAQAMIELSEGLIRFEFSDYVTQHTPDDTITTWGDIEQGKGSVSVSTSLAGRRRYPAPPTDFAWSPDVELMLSRYMDNCEGREPLPSMAYFCLSVLTSRVGKEKESRKLAAAKYHIEYEILAKIAELSNLGDDQLARKRHAQNRPLRLEEEVWLREVARALIFQVGRHEANPSSPKLLTMGDLLPLTEVTADT